MCITKAKESKTMKQEILEVIKKYTKAQKIDIKTDSNQNFNTLEVEILLEK